MKLPFFQRLKSTIFRKQQSAQAEHIHPYWSIGIYTGKTPDALSSPTGSINPVLTAKDVSDVPANFVADPFMLYEQGCWYMFFEIETTLNGAPIGRIGLATSPDGLHWRYEKVVLEESFHLSYPYVFKWQDQFYLVPETRSVREVRLYQAVDFPWKWQYKRLLLSGRRFADSSLFRFNDRWWMFSDAGNNTLRLYHSSELTTGWQEHRKSPILRKNPLHARPGGRVIPTDGTVLRFAQDCQTSYGKQVFAFTVTELTPKTYRETPITEPILLPGAFAWNRFGMHTVDPHQLADGSWIACVDGLGEK
ncbi:glucosamine inositolphosphorylceramide transferase family protein [Desulfobulbus oligotrophicus]|jgi:hypothetical protein|uniref:Glucosamine inositolphosphorylceramide transferase 1 N-terminal domain-containing protein n=1 Tax=Desulfobulbus oligotrophicus TaxID=1909699 RepID=A0A7T5VBR5_9BACT|nr:hypothetical protein [Desulfobulbus oligotrophicus]MDY0389994.1 hypothetical protein [Desulfobulbus oligotrophicus]QQG64962.1 hypothetical protein HP555_03315 [Desulfobulbus oligotrophicus]